MNIIPIKLGDIDLEAVVDENPATRGETTDKPVEKGQDISDHYQSSPATVNLTGAIVSEQAASKLATLKQYQKQAKLLRYAGRNIFDNMLIISVDTKHNSNNATGFHYDISLKQVKISQPETYQVKVVNPKTKKQDKKTATRVKKKTNKGRQQPKKKKVSKPKITKMQRKKAAFMAGVTQG